MATRFAMYQNSIKKFVSTQSIISEHPKKDYLLELIKGSDFGIPIILLTTMNGQQKKNKISTTHGYESATGMELLCAFVKHLNDTQILRSDVNMTRDEKFLCLHINPIVNMAFSKNIKSIMMHYTSEIVVNIFATGIEQINKKIEIIVRALSSEIPIGTSINKFIETDFHFENAQTPRQLKHFRQIPHDFMMKYISDIYGNICGLSLILGWILGGSPDNMIDNINRLGYHLGFLTKLSHDFENIESDIIKCSNGQYCLNYIVNYGMQNSFELFDSSKQKFNEGLLTLGITSPTIKEFIDILEKKVDRALDQSSPHIRQSLSPI